MATEEVNGEAMPWGKARVFTMVFDCIFAPRWAVGRRRRSQTDDDDNDDDDGDGGDDDNICPLMTAMRHATMTTFICPLPQFVSLAVLALPLEV